MFKITVISLISFFCLLSNVNAQIIDNVCPSEKNVKYAVLQNAGSTYVWSVTGGVIKSGNGTAEIFVDWLNQPGLFDISVIETNFLSCTGNQVLAKVLVNRPNFLINYPLAACINDSVTLTAGNGDKYLWSTGDIASSIKVKILRDTIFSVKISENTCSNITDSFYMKIKAISNPVVAFTPTEQDFYKDKSVYFQYLGDNKDKVFWIFDKSTVNKIFAQNANIIFTDTGQTEIKLTATNIFGCKDSLTKTINIKDEDIFMPNAFTPNNDGLNDLFMPVGHGIKSLKMTIYNRWGEEIFVSNSMQEGWNGTHKNTLLTPDVFVYIIEAVGYSGKSYRINGNVTLMR
ncbi:MAG: gliding motility-associated C-terminal domain-containing protein [Candidatus Methylacidiphilales bacterium]